MRIATWSLMIALASAVSFGQRPWQRPPEQWTDTEARQILADSPWAKSITARVWRWPASPGSTHPEPFPATVRWESATPVRIALRKVGLSPAVATDYAHFVVVVVSLPRKSSATMDARTSAVASLKPTGSQPLAAVSVKFLEQDDNQPLLAFTFPKTPDLTEPRELRLPFVLKRNLKKLSFHATIGDWEVDHEFPARQMLYLGQPAL